MGYKTKGDFLESIGKNRNDNKLVDRMIMRGEAVKTDDGYELVNHSIEVEELKKKVKKLEDMIALYDKVHNEDTEEYNKLVEEYEEYKRNTASNITMGEVTDFESKSSSVGDMADLEYLNNEYIKLEENRKESLRKCYEFMAGKKIFDKEKNPFEDFFYRATGEVLN